ncbi:MAG: MFS transporter [Clostridiales bacterium]|nr:MFS transporter [Clostridiales bacterium]
MKNLKLWWNKNIALFVCGNFVSRIGNVIFDIVMTWWLISETSSARYVGFVLGASTFAVALISPLSGALSDRYNKKYIMIITDFISGILSILIGIMAFNNYINVYLLILINFLMGSCASLFKPAVKSILPKIAKKEYMVQVNSISNNLAELTKFIGPALASVLVGISIIGIPGMFIFNGITYIISAISEIFIDYFEDDSKDMKSEGVFKNIKEGFSYLSKQKIIFKVIAVSSIVNIFIASYNILLPLFINNDLKLDGDFYSYILMAEAAGGIVITILFTFWSSIKPNLEKLFYALAFSGLALSMISIFANRYLILVSVFLFGLFLSAFNTLFFSYVQIVVDEKYLGRVFSTIFMIATFIMPVSYVVFGYIGDFVLKYIFLISGLSIILVSLPILSLSKSMDLEIIN